MLRLKELTLFEQIVLALSLVFLGFLLIEPVMLERARTLTPETRKFFRTITDIGRSNWMLIPTGAALVLALVLRKRHVGFRNSAGYGLIVGTIGFVFVSVGGAGLIANLAKNIIGRARPKLFDQVGVLDFKLFAFDPDYASLPSGHATNIFGDGRFAVLLPETDEIQAINYVERVRRTCDLWLESGAVALKLAMGWASASGDDSLLDAGRIATERMYAELHRNARRSSDRVPDEPAEETSGAESGEAYT